MSENNLNEGLRVRIVTLGFCIFRWPRRMYMSTFTYALQMVCTTLQAHSQWRAVWWHRVYKLWQHKGIEHVHGTATTGSMIHTHKAACESCCGGAKSVHMFRHARNHTPEIAIITPVTPLVLVISLLPLALVHGPGGVKRNRLQETSLRLRSNVTAVDQSHIQTCDMQVSFVRKCDEAVSNTTDTIWMCTRHITIH